MPDHDSTDARDDSSRPPGPTADAIHPVASDWEPAPDSLRNQASPSRPEARPGPDPTDGTPDTPSLPRFPIDSNATATVEFKAPESLTTEELVEPGLRPSYHVTPHERVTSLCEQFMGAWRPGDRPSIPSYLERIGEGSRSSLFRNLLRFEIERRRGEGEYPSAEEYLDRFPGHSASIREAFLESLSASTSSRLDDLGLSGAGISAGVPGSVRPLAAGRLGGYRLIRELGRGGMGVVYEAVHLSRGHRVALKVLPQVDGARLYRFKREFRSASGLSHPNLIGLHDLEADGDQWFFTMELIEGVGFLDHVRPSGRLDEARLRPALAQLVIGVMALHGHHVIHRDLKPSNIMVAADGRVLVLDFGLVIEQEPGLASRGDDRLAGTPAYMAPEQAAGLTVTSASDWYAVGVILYEALSGRRPFDGPLWRLLQAKQTLDPPPLSRGPAATEDLADLCMRLLERDPSKRPDAFEVAKKISTGLRAAPVAAATGPDRLPLVGRGRHLRIIEDAFRTLRELSDSQTVFIGGRSGEGKTTLAEHFLAPLREDGRLVIMSGRCYERESVPFKALDSLIDALASFLHTLPETEAALLMPDDIGVLARVFPVLQRVEVVDRASAAPPSKLDEQQVRQRAFGALRSLLNRIGRRGPVVWFIDDLQWGDSDSAEVLFGVLRPPEAPRVLFLGTFRSDETEGSPFLRTWDDLRRKHDARSAEVRVALSPLSVHECTELVIRLVGRDDEVVRRRAVEFARETGGNPFLLVELVGCFDPQTDSFRPMPLKDVLTRKLEQLPEGAGRFLDVVAVSGQAISLAEAARAVGHEVSRVSMITRMRTERLVRLIGPADDPQVNTYHDKIRETVLGHMEEASRRGLHKALAETIEATAGGVSDDEIDALRDGERRHGSRSTLARVYDLSYHFDASGEPRKAWAYALLAAEQARAQFALEVAAQQYEIARRNAGETPEQLRFRIAEGAGETLMLLGRYPAASEQLQAAHLLSTDPLTLAKVEVLQGETALKQGSLNRSVEIYEQALRRLGNPVPTSWPGYLRGLLREVAIQAAHTALPLRWFAREDAGDESLALTVRLLNRLQYARWFQSTPRLMWVHLYAMNQAERMSSEGMMAFNYSTHAIGALTWYSRGLRYNDRAFELRRASNDIWGQAHCRNFRGLGLYAAGRYRAALESFAQSIELFGKTGDIWEYNLAHYHTALCHYRLGELAEALEMARKTFEAGVRIGDDALPHFCIDLWAKASGGKLPFRELRGCFRAIPEDIQSTSQLDQAEGLWHLQEGRTEEAVGSFERGFARPRDHVLLNFHTMPGIPSFAMALRLRAESIGPTDPKSARRLRARAMGIARWARRLGYFLPPAFPHALRELSLLFEAGGRMRKALRLAEESCAAAERQEARYEYAQSALVRARLRGRLGQPGADVHEAEGVLDSFRRTIEAAAPVPRA